MLSFLWTWLCLDFGCWIDKSTRNVFFKHWLNGILISSDCKMLTSSCLMRKFDHHYWLFLSEHFWWQVYHDFFYFPDSLKHLRCSGTTKTILSSVVGLRNRGTDLESEEEKNIANSHLDSIMQLPNDIKMQCIGSVKYCI